MTRALPTLLALLAALASPVASAQAAPAVEVSFVNPTRFTDFRIDRFRGKRQVEQLAQELRRFLEHESPRHLPPGSKLTLAFTDIDMAGEFEGWQRTGAGDVRVVREMYPSRVNFTFSLADDTGKVVKEGERQLMSAFLIGPSPRGGDGPLRYERALLQDWLAKEFDTPVGR